MTSGAPRRINVVGLSGSGKSSVTRPAADLLSVPFIELDALHWILPEWQMPPLDEFRASVDAATLGGGWVVAGNYGKVRDIVWTRADTVVWLDLPLLITIWRVAVRTIRRVRRREMLWGWQPRALVVRPLWPGLSVALQHSDVSTPAADLRQGGRGEGFRPDAPRAIAGSARNRGVAGLSQGGIPAVGQLSRG